MSSPPEPKDTPGHASPVFASRGGLKLSHALASFKLEVQGLTCADLGCSTGGFTDCLLQAGALSVSAVDTAYGELAWKLRNDPRVTVMERTNALHAIPPNLVDLVVADMSWTPQRLVIPAAMKWLKPSGRIISLVKPHYELRDRDAKAVPRGGVLDLETAERICQEVVHTLPAMACRVLGCVQSPVLGTGGSKGKAKGNAEWLVMVERA
jgi:23S rRNA (cytidine1920-2'-O)/16S rRNA (cytidine1409-2'-O)-methyltransferase